MTDYIKREDVIELINSLPWTSAEQTIRKNLIILFTLYDAADVVEVVRCKDCRLYNTDNCYMIHGQRMNRDLFEDDFCSYGERKDEIH